MSFAFSIYDDKKLVQWGEIKFVGKNVFERLADGQDKVRALRDVLQVDKVAIESAVYVQNKKTVILLAYAFGAIISALVQSGAEVIEISPMVWQNAIGNKVLTKAEKSAIVDANPDKSKSWYTAANRDFRKARTARWVKETLGPDIDNDNVTDAIALGWVVATKEL